MTKYSFAEREDKMMQVGDVVIYESKVYKIVHIYDSGFCEIKKKDSTYEVLLVKLSELSPQSLQS